MSAVHVVYVYVITTLIVPLVLWPMHGEYVSQQATEASRSTRRTTNALGEFSSHGVGCHLSCVGVLVAAVFQSWGTVAGWLASRTLDPRVVSSNPGISVTRACVPGQNTLPLIARVFSDRTLKIVGPFYLVSMPGEVKGPTRVI